LSRSAVNFWVDFSLLVMLCTVLWISAVIHFVFPPGARTEGWLLWGGDFDRWQLVQVVALSVFALNVLLHLILHWTWICGFLTSRMSKKLGRRIVWDEGIKTLYGVGSLIGVLTLLGSLLLVAELQIRAPRGIKGPDTAARAAIQDGTGEVSGRTAVRSDYSNLEGASRSARSVPVPVAAGVPRTRRDTRGS